MTIALPVLMAALAGGVIALIRAYGLNQWGVRSIVTDLISFGLVVWIGLVGPIEVG